MIERAEELVTVFGGGGFIGRYVCELLMKSGVRVRVAQRNPRQAYIIQPLGQVGQFGFEAADITNADSVRRAVQGATAVVNLCGVFGAKMRRRPCRRSAQCRRGRARSLASASLVHVSAIGASLALPLRPTAVPRPRERRQSATRFPAGDDRPPVAGLRPRGQSHQSFRGHGASCHSFRLSRRSAISSRFMFATSPRRSPWPRSTRSASAARRYEVGGPQVMSMVDLHRAILEITGQRPDLVPTARFLRRACCRASAGCPARRSPATNG